MKSGFDLLAAAAAGAAAAVAGLGLLLAGCPRAGSDAAGEAGAPSDGGAPPTCTGGDRLSATGLWADAAAHVVAPDLLEFAPAYVLWSDGATKRRWLRLPPGTTIDTSDLDHWVLPVGAQLFKEFTRDGVLVETRCIERTGEGPFDYWMGAFVWLADGSDAVFAVDGATDVNGTPHDVPSAMRCWTCHIGEPGRALGVSAVQLGGGGAGSGLTVAALAAAGLLSDPPPAGASYAAPGDAVTAAALGTLHANCGHCHNPSGAAWPDTDLELRLDVVATVPEATPAWITAVDVPLTSWIFSGFIWRIASGSPAQSAVLYRDGRRGEPAQMPPIDTEIVDPAGLAAVSDWIVALP